MPPIIWTPELLGVFLLSLLTRKHKLDISAKRQAGHTISQLALEYGIHKSDIRYLCHLIARHGSDILDLMPLITDIFHENNGRLSEAMEEYILYYNERRITKKLKGLMPVAYRRQSLDCLAI